MATAPTTPLADVRADFPVLTREWNGHRIAYIDSAATSQKPNVGARDDGPLPARDQRQRAPRRLRPRARGHRAVRGGARAHRPLRRGRGGHDDLHPQRHRGDQPRGVCLGPRQPRPRRRGARNAHGAPLEHRPLAAGLPGHRCEAALPERRRRRHAFARRARLGARRGTREARRRRARVERARHDQPGGGDRRAGPALRAPWCSSTAPRRCRRCRWTCPRSAPTSTPGPGTRHSAPRAWACCTDAASCSSRCGPSSRAGT